MPSLVLWCWWNKGRVISWDALIARLIWEPKAKWFCLASDDFRGDSFGEGNRIWKCYMPLCFVTNDHLPFLFRIWRDLRFRSRGLFQYILLKCYEFRVLLKIKSMRMTQGSLFSAVPTLRLRIRVRFSSGPEIFLFVAASSMSPGSLYSVDTYCLSSGVKWPVIVFPSCPFNVDLKNTWSYTSTSFCFFMKRCLTIHMDL